MPCRFARWFVVLLMLLVPLRGFAGDVMALQMALGGANTASAMPDDCEMDGRPAAADGVEHAEPEHLPSPSSSSSPSPASPSAAPGCGTCDLCLPFTPPAAVRLPPLACAAVAQPVSQGHAFASAPAALAFKPPIS